MANDDELMTALSMHGRKICPLSVPGERKDESFNARYAAAHLLPQDAPCATISTSNHIEAEWPESEVRTHA